MSGRALDPAWLNDRSEFQRNFIHGLRNPAGLQLQYRLEGDRVVTEWTPDERHVGFPGFVHGGLIGAVLDDAMGRSTTLRRLWVVTARQETRFRAGAPAGQTLRFEGWMTRYQRRVVTAAGRALLGEGTVVAESTATYLPLTADLQQRMVEAWPGFAPYLGQEHEP